MLLLFQEAILSPSLLTNFGMAGAVILVVFVMMKHSAAERALGVQERKDALAAYLKSLDDVTQALGTKLDHNGAHVGKSLDAVAAELKYLREKLPA